MTRGHRVSQNNARVYYIKAAKISVKHNRRF